MDRYLGGEDIDLEVLIDDLETAVARGVVLPGRRRGCSPTGVGMRRAARPASPAASRRRSSTRAPDVSTPGRRAARRRSPATPTGPLVAEIVKTTSDPYVGRISAWSASSPAPCARTRPCTSPATSRRSSARAAATRTTTSTSGSVRCPSPLGKTQRHGRAVRSPATSCAIAKLTRAETGDTLSDKDDPLLMRAVARCPTRCCRSRSSRTVQGRRGQALAGPRPARRRGPDAARSRTTPRPTSWCCGAWARRTLDVLLDRLRDPLRRRTSTGAAAGVAARDVRRAGEGPRPARQAVRRPRPVRRLRHRGRAAARRAAGFEFVDKVVGGAVPAPVHPLGREGRARPDGARRRAPATRSSTSG